MTLREAILSTLPVDGKLMSTGQLLGLLLDIDGFNQLTGAELTDALIELDADARVTERYIRVWRLKP